MTAEEDKKDIEARPSDFDKVYNSIKDSPEAVEELNGIMEDTIERMRALVEKHEALNAKDPASVTDDELVALTKEEYKIEEDRLDRITDLLKRELARKESDTAAYEAEIRRLTRIKHRMENNNRKIYPNDPCPCGSGKKYKKCCGRK